MNAQASCLSHHLKRAPPIAGAPGITQMPGVRKQHRIREFGGRRFPASRYDDPRGGRASGLERNAFRYRAVEAALYLFYAEEVRDFMLTNVHPRAAKELSASPSESTEERRLQAVLSRVLTDAESTKKLSAGDADAIRRVFSDERQQGKKLRVAFAHGIALGMFTAAEADELKGLLDYRNDIAHRIHLVMADISRCYWTTDRLSFTAPTYKGDALDKLRGYRRSLWKRADKRLILTLSTESLTFEFTERVYEHELKRLDRLIQAQIMGEHHRLEELNAELDLRGTELVDDLDSRFPRNHRSDRSYGDDYIPATGHLTKRGIEICYRLYDIGKSTLAVAHLMGMTLRSAERRQQGWLKAGGPNRVRAEVKRYDMAPYCRRKPTAEAGSSA